MGSVAATIQIVLLHPAEPDFDASVSWVALNCIGGEVDIVRATDVESALAVVRAKRPMVESRLRGFCIWFV